MSNLKPELSKRNKYYLEKHRYYELYHFCLQYPIWKKAYAALDSLSRRPEDLALFNTNEHGNPTERCALARERYFEMMRMVEDSAREADETLWKYILKGVTEDCTYDTLRLVYDIPCCRETYYKTRRKFFYILNTRKKHRPL